MVKILCASDTHGLVDIGKLALSAIRRKVNVLVLAGDIQPARLDMSPDAYFNFTFIPSMMDLYSRGIDVVITPGNHDFWLKSRFDSGYIKKEFGSRIHLLVDKAETVCGLKFYGTPWVPFINGQWCWERADNCLDEKFDLIPCGIDVLVCHTPPEGVGEEETFDVSRQHNKMYWKHFGSKSLREAILRCRPRCVVCGHIHSGDHRLNRIGDTALINCSLIDERYSEAYKPAEIIVETVGESVEMKFRTGEDMKWKTINQIGGAYDV